MRCFTFPTYGAQKCLIHQQSTERTKRIKIGRLTFNKESVTRVFAFNLLPSRKLRVAALSKLERKFLNF